MLYKAGQNEEAESAFRRALALEPKLWAARTGLANVLSDTFRDELAENEFRRLIAEHQKSVIYAQFADFLLSLDRSDEALEMARMGVSLDPESADAIRMLGKVLSVSDPRKADQAFQRAIALDPSDAYARYTYGFFLAQFEEKLDAARSNLEFAAQHGVLAAAQKLARLGKPPDSDDD
jgi:Tfp pilus assembly protein PilF